jgi:type VI secretion system ImpM family protein
VLGRIRAKREWCWTACGKHPSARDYFRLGTGIPLSRAFSQWMDRGFEDIAGAGSARQSGVSWRFWCGEARKDHVACGIVKDSADSVGRPYPLLIMGSGPLHSWDSNWDLVPFACENAWSQMEYLSVTRFTDLKVMEKELHEVKAPRATWPDFLMRRDSTGARVTSTSMSHLARSGDDPFLRLDDQPGDPFDLIVSCHQSIRTDSTSFPSAIFAGGSARGTYFVVFRRALTTADFARLWNC